jgi:ADP-ribose pyrophosphatase YjhB (NUDIX family)
VEAEESPHAACRREVAEELGLDRPPGRVLAVDWVPSRPELPEGLVVVYDGGVLSAGEIKEIVLADGELAGFAFVSRGEVAGLVTPLLARRVASCRMRWRPGRWRRWRTAARPPDDHHAALTCLSRRASAGRHDRRAVRRGPLRLRGTVGAAMSGVGKGCDGARFRRCGD